MDQTNPQDIQALVQELQLARNQIQTVSTQINEISLTLLYKLVCKIASLFL